MSKIQTTHVSSKWYKYEANRLIQNYKNFDEFFPNRKYISSEDIIEHVSYCRYGCHLLLTELRSLKKKLKIIEEQIKNGFWVKKNTASISSLTSYNIDRFIDDISSVNKLKELSDIIHENLYISYFFTTLPNIYLPDPRIPTLPQIPKETVNINDKDNIIKLITNTIPYLNVLETYHMIMYNLILNCNQGLEKIISK